MAVVAITDGHPSDSPVYFTKYLDPRLIAVSPVSGYGAITSVVVRGVALAGGSAGNAPSAWSTRSSSSSAASAVDVVAPDG